MIKKSIKFILFFLLAPTVNSFGQQSLTLEQCRNLAIENNKALKVVSEQERVAYYEKKQAYMQYFPKLSASGTFLHFSDNLHLIGQSSIPTAIPLPPALGLGNGIPIDEGVRDAIYKAGEVDLSQFWLVGFSLTQPLYAGGRIVAANDIRSYAMELAKSQKDTKMTNIIVEVDEAYWQVVSLTNKKELAKSYVDLLKKMDSDIYNMEQEGVATKADRLSVSVKLNEAEMTLTKATNGVSLSKMLLSQICGLEVDDNISLADENIKDISITDETTPIGNIDEAIGSRSEIRSLQLASKIYEKKEKIAFAEYLPTAGLSIGYNWMKPNLHDGLQNRFDGMWNIAVSVKVPLNFISSSAKVNAAKAETRMQKFQYEEAKEKIKLQINQSNYKLIEANKKLAAAYKNTEKADENLRYANVGFEEGVIPASDALAAHTAWISAHAELIDAQIDLKLCKIYLNKALGRKL